MKIKKQSDYILQAIKEALIDGSTEEEIALLIEYYEELIREEENND